MSVSCTWSGLEGFDRLAIDPRDFLDVGLGALFKTGPGSVSRAMALPPRWSRVEMMERGRPLIIILTVLALGALAALAHASPLDPLWISGVYDGDDHDDAVLAAASTEANAVGGAIEILRASCIVVGVVRLDYSSRPVSSTLPAFDGRAPPPSA